MGNRNILQNFLLMLLMMMGSMKTCWSQHTIPSNYKKAILYFGQGGGFTGAVTSYALLENGRLFRKNSLTGNEFIRIGRLKKSEAEQLFKNYTFLGIPSMYHEDPGNIYSFVEYAAKNTNHKLTWGGSSPAPDNLKLFYTILNHYIPNH